MGVSRRKLSSETLRTLEALYDRTPYPSNDVIKCGAWLPLPLLLPLPLPPLLLLLLLLLACGPMRGG
jgi:hypothetical protein